MSSNPIKFESLSRLSSLPLVSSAITIATDGYTKIKSYNRLLSATLSGAEHSIVFMALTAKPVIAKLEKPISIADGIACQGLEKLQQKVPAIKKSPEEIKVETQKLYTESVGKIGHMRKYSTDKLQGMKDYGYSKVNGVLDFPLVKAFLGSIDTAIEMTDSAVDHYLPPSPGEPVSDEDKGQQTLVVRMSHLSEKMHRRLYNQIWVPIVSETFNRVRASLTHWFGQKPLETSHLSD